MDAVREALMNSFCHKDYGAFQSNEVAIHPDRVEIYNPGAFPEGLSPEDFIEGTERPIRRNPLIASILYYSKDIESFGTGLKRIVDSCRDSNCRYEFKRLKSGFVVVFYRNNVASADHVSDVSGFDPINDPINSSKIQRLLDLVRKNPSMTYNEYATILGISTSTIKRLLQELVKKGKIKREGSNKSGGWKILN